MTHARNISFGEAWKDFLILRGIPYKLKVVLYIDSKQRVIRIEAIDGFVKRELDGEQFYCDESTTSITLAYPKSVVIPEIENKILKPYLGKRLEKRQIDSLRGRTRTFEEEMNARLGRAIRTEIEKLISDGSYWEALFSLHQVLEHRLRKMLMYGCMVVDKSKSTIFVNHFKQRICKEIQSFKHLTNIAFLVRAIDETTRTKLLSFNSERSNIAHELLTSQISRDRLKNQCDHGLKLMDTLEKRFAKIVPKPKFVRMQKFEVMP